LRGGFVLKRREHRVSTNVSFRGDARVSCFASLSKPLLGCFVSKRCEHRVETAYTIIIDN